MSTTMTISNPDWTFYSLAVSHGVEFAVDVHNYLVDHADAEFAKDYHVDGWTFVDGAFTGPATETSNLPGYCQRFVDEAVEEVVEGLTGRYRTVIGADGCGDPITAELDRNGHETEGSERTEHRRNCFLAAVVSR